MEFNGMKLPDNAYDLLVERGLIAGVTNPEIVRELMEKEKITFYIGFDPTADSLHVGHFLQLLVMRYMQMYGHRPIALIGGGTCMIGDPSGKADMRRIMPREEIDANGEKFKVTMKKLLDFSESKAIMLNNADWLMELNYVNFLREVGWHFSVNKMLSADAFKVRMDRDIGLTFTEFNYMLMQGYDFYHLFNAHMNTTIYEIRYVKLTAFLLFLFRSKHLPGRIGDKYLLIIFSKTMSLNCSLKN